MLKKQPLIALPAAMEKRCRRLLGRNFRFAADHGTVLVCALAMTGDGLRTLDTAAMKSNAGIDCEPDTWVFSMFRSIAGMVITSGENVRAEKNLTMEIPSKDWRDFRREMVRSARMQGELPRPMVLTRNLKNFYRGATIRFSLRPVMRALRR